MASRQSPKSAPSTSTMGLRGGTSNSSVSASHRQVALPKSDTLGIKGGTSVGCAGKQNPSVSLPVGAIAGEPSVKK